MQPEQTITQTASDNQAAPEIKKDEVKQEAIATKEAQAQDTPERINWRKFREEREKERKMLEQERRHREEKEKEAAALKAAMDAILNKPNPQQNQQQPDYEDLSEHERIQKLVKEELEREREKDRIARQQREAADLPNNLQKTFGDFNQTCSTENLDYLEFHYPEVAQAYKYMPDGFDKWANIYKAVKRFVPNNDSHKDATKAEKNALKPQSASSPGVSQGGQAPTSYILTEERRAANWARMERVRKGLS